MFESESDSDVGSGWSNVSFSNVSIDSMKDKFLWNINDWDILNQDVEKMIEFDEYSFKVVLLKSLPRYLVFKIKMITGPPSKVGISLEIVDQSDDNESITRFRQIFFENNTTSYTFDTSVSIESVNDMILDNNLRLLLKFMPSKVKPPKNTYKPSPLIQPLFSNAPKEHDKIELKKLIPDSPEKVNKIDKIINETLNLSIPKRDTSKQDTEDTSKQIPEEKEKKIEFGINKESFQVKSSINEVKKPIIEVKKKEYNDFDGFPKPFEDSDDDLDFLRSSPLKTNKSPIVISDSSTTTPVKNQFNGIKNQGCTCYMNSFLQALYHIPVFRSLIYRIDTSADVKAKKLTIPLAMQRLFADLQIGTKLASTQELTQSFGWTESEILQQHDIEEFARLLLDTLEEKLKKTDEKNAIADIFKGTTKSFIKCTNVDFTKTMEGTFYDLQMPIKNVTSLEESFERYTQPEILSGESQYDADRFGKQDAIYFTKFSHFPKVLCLLLNRFESDMRGTRKINSKLEFKTEIDLKNYLAEGCDEPAEYKLFGVLVHNGSTIGGHYYAFLDVEGEWYKFNDSLVSPATENQAVDDNAGGNYSAFSSAIMGSMIKEKAFSAYVLIYIKKDAYNSVFQEVSANEIPEYIFNNDDV